MPNDPRREQAKNLRKEQNYTSALPLYEALWNEGQQSDAWDGWGYAFCLYKLKRYEEGLEVSRLVYKIDSEMELNRKCYADCIFGLEIDVEPIENFNRFLNAADGILKLVNQDNLYAPFTRTVFAVCKELKARDRFEDVLAWLDRLDASLLSSKPFSFTNERGREQKAPSDVQRYYTFRAKALLETGQYEACITCVQEGLDRLTSFTNDGDLWLKWNAARAEFALGRTEAAHRCLTQLLHRKETWFLHEELARIARALGKNEEAWGHLYKALLDREPLELRINLFQLAAEWHQAENDLDAAREHLRVALSIRQENGWPVKEPLRALAETLELPSTGHPASAELVRSLRNTWEQRVAKDEERLTGEIRSVVSEGKAGFVQTPAGDSYFFSARDAKYQPVQAGDHVSFQLKPGFDRKKNVETTNAWDLKKLSAPRSPA